MAASDNYFHTYLQFFFHEFVKLWHPAEGEVTVGQEHPVTLRGKTTVMLKKTSATHSLAWAKATPHLQSYMSKENSLPFSFLSLPIYN